MRSLWHLRAVIGAVARLTVVVALVLAVSLLAVDFPAEPAAAQSPEDASVADFDPSGLPVKDAPAHPNLDTPLNDAVERHKSRSASGLAAAATAPHLVTVYVSGNADRVANFLRRNGGNPFNVGEDYIEAYVPVSLLGRLSERPAVRRISTIVPPRAVRNNGVERHGDNGTLNPSAQVHQAEAWHAHGWQGSVKVGIIDWDFGPYWQLAAADATGGTAAVRCYTGPGQYTANAAQCPGQGDYRFHGAKVYETVRSIAPGAQLYLANPKTGGDLISTVDWMIEQEVQVINLSLAWSFDGPGDGTSPFSNSPLRAVDKAVAGGASWLSGAGNFRGEAWYGAFNDPDNDGVLNFSEDDETNTMRFWPGSSIVAFMRWDDSWEAAACDLDLYLASVNPDSTLAVVAKSENVQNGTDGDVPYEEFTYEHSESAGSLLSLVIRKSESCEESPAWVQVMVWDAPRGLQYASEGYEITAPAESANPGHLAVGASHWVSNDVIAFYSSRGPAPDGRIKPDIVGSGSVRTSYGWVSGTSISAPHLSGMAALTRQRFDFTPQELAQYLKEHAAPRGDAVPNNVWGHGFAQMPPMTDHLDDLNGLRAIYTTNGGANWQDNEAWMSNRPVNEWARVTTGPDGRVTGLNLHHNNLSGSLPPALGAMTGLRVLALNGNHLGGVSAGALGGLVNLEELNLNDNVIDSQLWPELGNLSGLRTLRLDNNLLHGGIPSEFQGLTGIREMTLSGNRLSGPIPPELGSLTNLERLDLSNNDLSGSLPESFGSLSNLRSLLLSGNPNLSGPLPLFLTSSSLAALHFDGTGLCAPLDADFQAWLAGMEYAGPNCEPPGDALTPLTMATPSDPPGAAPSGLNLASTSLPLTLTWQPGAADPPYTAQWLIRREITADQQGLTDWTRLATLGSEVSEYVDNSIVAGKHYRYRIRPVRDGAPAGPLSNKADISVNPPVEVEEPEEPRGDPLTPLTMAAPSDPPGAAPSGLNLASTSLPLTLTWQPGADDPPYTAQWLIRREITADQKGLTDWTSLAILAPGVNQYIDNSIAAGKHYRYRIRPVRDGAPAGPLSNKADISVNWVE